MANSTTTDQEPVPMTPEEREELLQAYLKFDPSKPPSDEWRRAWEEAVKEQPFMNDTTAESNRKKRKSDV